MSASPDKPSTVNLLLLPGLACIAVVLCTTYLPETWWRTALVLAVTLVGAFAAGLGLRAQSARNRAAQRDQEALDGLEPLPRNRPDAR
ncbi:hypothetical protein [Kineococcus sp. SYSU DK006]|uniref:hypothetical protein n=1 Tax=Kineococcus sp. SYSU DK006 TaxID=3383127 RepID=UPI003D7CE201